MSDFEKWIETLNEAKAAVGAPPLDKNKIGLHRLTWNAALDAAEKAMPEEIEADEFAEAAIGWNDYRAEMSERLAALKEQA